MRYIRGGMSIALMFGVVLGIAAPQIRPVPRKKLLAIGDVRTGYQHDSVSHGLSTIERLGYESGVFDTYIRTDSQLLTKQPVLGPKNRSINAKNLNFFDAILFFGTGEGDLTDQQKADLMSFIKDDGKGVVGAHTGNDAFFEWPEYGEMMGGYFDNHPWGVFDAPVIVEDPEFPAMRHFPLAFTLHDEIYELKGPYSRSKVRVLARLDPNKLDYSKKDIHRTDKDFPVAFARNFGKGRVFWSTFGHTQEAWDNKDIQTMYFEAIKWVLKLVDANVTPRSLPPADD